VTTDAIERPHLLRRGLLLELLTVGWNILEGVIAVTAALAASSVALLGFGIDSFVETSSGLVMLWRLASERSGLSGSATESLDRKAHQLIGVTLLALAAFVAWDATSSLWTQERPAPTLVGIVLTSVSLVVMLWLARAKRRIAIALRSRAMEADAFQTTACWWLSLITLTGIGLNALFGWWWADPVAALGITVFLVKEGREGLRGEPCCE
jgi:divalent metal cation (Fe/Co/Zn/Cd) transporter